MTDKTETPAEALKRALAAKKAKAPNHPGASLGATAEKTMAAKSAALSKPAFRKASKRG